MRTDPIYGLIRNHLICCFLIKKYEKNGRGVGACVQFGWVNFLRDTFHYMSSSLHWFRKGLRLHDNPALAKAIEHVRMQRGQSSQLYFLFVLDPWFASPGVVGPSRCRFLLESLQDLDTSLHGVGSLLHVAKGDPIKVIPRLAKEWSVGNVTWEVDTDPYARDRDEKMRRCLSSLGVNVDTSR